ncbi:hypothetical protein JO83_03955 [Avibacterium paragallinarum]|nr:super-infection exclusion protein B [Avibacterium paragallinarum]TID28076.1 hypothetical protein JO83_03955 [Avibacterium paragallinarum]
MFIILYIAVWISTPMQSYKDFFDAQRFPFFPDGTFYALACFAVAGFLQLTIVPVIFYCTDKLKEKIQQKMIEDKIKSLTQEEIQVLYSIQLDRTVDINQTILSLEKKQIIYLMFDANHSVAFIAQEYYGEIMRQRIFDKIKPK